MHSPVDRSPVKPVANADTADSPDASLAQAAAKLNERLSGGWHADRVLKTALAVAMAWWLGQLLGEALPIFAALAALQAVRPTVVESLRQTGGQVVGMVLGSVLATAAVTLLGTTTPAVIGLSAGVALLVTTLLHATRFVGAEIASTTLFVIWYTAHQQSQTALDRIWEAALGGAVAIAVNALLWPPDYSRDVHRTIEAMIQSVVAHTTIAVNNFVEPPPPAQARADFLAARDAVHIANNLARDMKRIPESLRFSPLLRRLPWNRGWVERSVRFAANADFLVMALEHARAATWSAWEASRHPLANSVVADEWRAAVAAVAAALAHIGHHLHTGTDSARQAALTALADARQAHAVLLARAAPATPHSWEAAHNGLVLELGYLLDDLGMLLGDPLLEHAPELPRP